MCTSCLVSLPDKAKEEFSRTLQLLSSRHISPYKLTLRIATTIDHLLADKERAPELYGADRKTTQSLFENLRDDLWALHDESKKLAED